VGGIGKYVVAGSDALERTIQNLERRSGGLEVLTLIATLLLHFVRRLRGSIISRYCGPQRLQLFKPPTRLS
jgi:hypothetical protein